MIQVARTWTKKRVDALTFLLDKGAGVIEDEHAVGVAHGVLGRLFAQASGLEEGKGPQHPKCALALVHRD
jgi:hypothetical protein